MTMRAPFTLVDVFTTVPFGGNQLGVFTAADSLSATDMQAAAHELNFSECAFVLKPGASDAVKKVRIFTPAREFLMAGHPTIGTAWVLASRGDIKLHETSTDAVLELGIGPVTVTVESIDGKPNFVWMAHREAVFGTPRRDRARVAKVLGIAAADIRTDLPMQGVSTGNPFLLVPLRSVEALGKCRRDEVAIGKLLASDPDALGLYLFVASSEPPFGVRARMFALPDGGVGEDAATGSAAAPLGSYLARHEVLPNAEEAEFVVEQGVEIRRSSRIHVKVRRQGGDVLEIRIGGRCVIVGEGEISAP
jgi:trans-2,3-dihydro-3-hydroxyanthranilate isomerase